MYISNEGVEFIAYHEGLFLNPYNCPSNHCTVGYGHLIHYGPCDDRDSEQEFKNMTKESALKLLQDDMVKYCKETKNLLKVKLSQNQFDALVSLEYNIGQKNLRLSTVLKFINDPKYKSNRYESAEQAWKAWKHGANHVLLLGLVKRRANEWKLYSEGEYI